MKKKRPILKLSGQGLIFQSAHRFSRKGLSCEPGERIRIRSRNGQCGSATIHLHSDEFRDPQRMIIWHATDRIAKIRLNCKHPGTESSEQIRKPTIPPREGETSRGSSPQNIEWKIPDWRCWEPQTVKLLLDSYGIKTRIHSSKTVDPDCPAGTVISQSPAAGKTVKSGQEVELTVNPTRQVKLYINLSPQAKNDRYRVGTTLYMTSEIIGRELYPDAKAIWWIDGKEVAEGDTWVFHLKQAGSYRIMFELRSRNGKTIDAVSRTITVVDTPKKAECGRCRIHIVEPEKNTYQPGDTVKLTATGLEDVCPITWYDNGNVLETHERSITLTLDNTPLHRVELRSEHARCFIKLHTKKENRPRPIGHHVNQFELVKIPEKDKGVLSICLKELVYGKDPKTLPCDTFTSYRHVPPYQYWLGIGDQSDGFNAGYLLYRKTNDPLIHFAVLHRRFRTLIGNHMGYPYGLVAYEGTIPHTEGVPIHQLYREVHANLVKLSWKAKNNHYCRAIIGKYKKEMSLSNPQVYLHEGLEFLGCDFQSGFDREKLPTSTVPPINNGRFTAGLDIKVNIGKDKIIKKEYIDLSKYQDLYRQLEERREEEELSRKRNKKLNHSNEVKVWVHPDLVFPESE
jgi:hypothetical protein